MNSVTSYDEWSYSDLDPSSEFMREASSTMAKTLPSVSFRSFLLIYSGDIVSNSVSDPDWIRIQSVSGSGSGSRRSNMTHINRK